MLAFAVSSGAAAPRAPHPCRSGSKARHCAARQWVAHPAGLSSSRRWQRAAAAAAAEGSSTDPAAAAEDEADGAALLPEEDQQIPGGYRDAMSSNTPLGKAVKGACRELNTLGDLERQTLEEAEGLLKKMGFTGSLFQGAPSPQPAEDEDEEEGEEEEEE